MNHLLSKLKTLFKDSCGQDLIEFALLVGLVALSTAATMPKVAQQVRVVLTKTRQVVTCAASTGGTRSRAARTCFGSKENFDN
jgi:Flp pilus assembly pilin Flp